MTIDVERCRADLDELERELDGFTGAGQPGLEVWKHKVNAVIDEVAGARSSLAVRFNGLRWEPSGSAARRRLDARGPMAMYGEPVAAVFRSAKQEAREVIEALRWDLGRLAPTTEPFSEATIDSELWEHVRGLIEADDWEKVARESAVFVESKLRDWASLSAVPGSTEVFKQAFASGKFTLGGSASETQGWQQLAGGFSMALRNRTGHRVETRGDAKRYALGVLGTASLLLTEIRHDYGDPPVLPTT